MILPTMSLQSYLQYRSLRTFLRAQGHAIAPKHDATIDLGHVREQEAYIMVDFASPEDPADPHNWTFRRKILTTLILSTAGLAGGWASASDSMITQQAQTAFRSGAIVESLATGLYLVGFGIGSLFSGPFSETVGRNPVYLITLLLLIIFVAISGIAPTIEVQLTFRLLAGMMGPTGITTFAGTTADLWAPEHRGLVFTIYSAFTFCCVFLAPVAGGFFGESTSMSWRWADYITLMVAGISAVLIFLLGPETYAPKILSWRAAILRKETGNNQYRSEHELQLDPLWQRLWRSTYRPFDLLLHELSLVLFTLYLSFLYIVCFTFLTGYSYIYGDIYHLAQSKIGLCFLGLDVGIILAAALGLALHFVYKRKLRAAALQNQYSLLPEDRLLLAVVTAPCLPGGLFWMAWTSSSSISLWSSLAGSVLIGIAFLGQIVATYLYIIDAFGSNAASALSIGAMVRYVCAGIMVPVSIPMYEHLSVHWTLTLLGCISLVLTPVPYVMWKLGPAIRSRSRVATQQIIAMEEPVNDC